MRTFGVLVLAVVFGVYGWHAFNLPGYRLPGVLFMGFAVALVVGGLRFGRSVMKRDFLYFSDDGGRW